MNPAPQLPPRDHIEADVSRALAEDIRDGDCTARLIPADARLQTRVICREHAILSGRAWFDETFRQLDSNCRINWLASDSDTLATDQLVCELEGNARTLLSGERTALNFLQTLSGTASHTQKFVAAVAGTGTVILDTRKTLPGLRLAQKYAVLCGGGRNHRIGLFDAILIKENHIAAAGSITAAVVQAARDFPELLLEVEVENIGQLEEAHRAGAQRVLLDNFSLEALEAAVTRFKSKIELEASGGISLDTVRSIAATGVDFISTGEITKSVRATDFSMRFI